MATSNGASGCLSGVLVIGLVGLGWLLLFGGISLLFKG